MKLIIEKTDEISGKARIPSSKSHTIRGFIFASLADKTSKLHNSLESEDTKATINACSSLGAEINRIDNREFEIVGFDKYPKIRKTEINTMNSGTTTNFITSVAALANETILIDGDESIRRRPVEPLLAALRNLGAHAISLKKNGCPPIEIKGRMKGGKTILDCRSSQYLSSLLISCPLLQKDTEIEIINCCEIPYIEMTLKWLDELNIKYRNNDFKKVQIYGNQKYSSFEKTIPSDWSSATFVIASAVMVGDNITILGLDPNDSQADRHVLDYLHDMGAEIKVERNNIMITKSRLHGCELDLNNTPDALPTMAVLGCYAKGTTILKNVAHARIKETDRIKVMTAELSKMNANIEETDDGMIIHHSKLKGTRLRGHYDHRIVMALSLAGMIADGQTEIDSAEAVKVTFPNYVEIMKNLGAKISLE
ncbi:3-phosphoshikimate 1-carboxyvinyltransferase [[Eubacterium] cellulosolvens]